MLRAELCHMKRANSLILLARCSLDKTGFDEAGHSAADDSFIHGRDRGDLSGRASRLICDGRKHSPLALIETSLCSDDFQGVAADLIG